MQEFLHGFITWPTVMWPLVAAAIAMFTLIASLDKKMLNHWAALAHFMCAAVAGLNWFWGQADDIIYLIFSRHAFWLNLVMMVMHLIVFWVNEERNAKKGCLIAADED
ncbi:MAG: hypothetical protein U9Q03_05880 [Patescibacteria group bacterium]|nr:hypothetical protein [Patescibacteria group bacterium]